MTFSWNKAVMNMQDLSGHWQPKVLGDILNNLILSSAAHISFTLRFIHISNMLIASNPEQEIIYDMVWYQFSSDHLAMWQTAYDQVNRNFRPLILSSIREKMVSANLNIWPLVLYGKQHMVNHMYGHWPQAANRIKSGTSKCPNTDP